MAETKPGISVLLKLIRRSVERIEAELHERRGPRPRPAELARRLYRQARLRERHFPGLFGDPSWMIVLDLYVARDEGRPVTVSSACRAGRVPITTGLRVLERLEKAGVSSRKPDAGDRRRVNVELTDDAAGRMTLLLEALGDQLQAPD